MERISYIHEEDEDYNSCNKRYIDTKTIYWKNFTPNLFNEGKFCSSSSNITSSDVVLIVGLIFLIWICGFGLIYVVKYICESGECTRTSHSPPPTPHIMSPPLPIIVTAPPPDDSNSTVIQNEAIESTFNVYDATDKTPIYTDVPLQDFNVK